MTHATHHDWTVDLAAGLASRDADVLQFDPAEREGMAIAFVAGGDCSLEERCLIAGEAAFAIWEAIDDASRPAPEAPASPPPPG